MLYRLGFFAAGYKWPNQINQQTPAVIPSVLAEPRFRSSSKSKLFVSTVCVSKVSASYSIGMSIKAASPT